LFWAYAADVLNPASKAIKKTLLLKPIDSSERSLSKAAYKQGEGSANAPSRHSVGNPDGASAGSRPPGHRMTLLPYG
jgi:hypothetical protein